MDIKTDEQSSDGVGEVLREPEAESETKSLFPSSFTVKGGRKLGMASPTLPRPKKAKPRSAGSRQLEVVGPKTEAALEDGIIDADFIQPDGTIIAPSRTKKSAVAKWAQMRALEPSLTNAEIAARLGISVISLNGYITQGKKEGWLKFEDPMTRMEHEIIPKTVENLNYFLDKKDRVATIEAAKGTIFKTYQESKGVVDQQAMVLSLRIEQADGANTKIVTGHIVGKSKVNQD